MASTTQARFEIRPNSSLSPAGARLFLASAGLFCLGPALVCVWLGFWPVLPFAGLEFGALVAATWWSMEKSRYREVIIIRDDVVSVAKIAPGQRSREVLPLHWCRARLVPGKTARSPKKLKLQAGMQSCEVASCCTESERVQLWQRLHSLIGPINRTPQPRTAHINSGNPKANQKVGTHVQ